MTPSDFLSLAENSGQSLKIGEYFQQYVPRDTIIKIHRGYVKNISSKKEDKEFLCRMIDIIKSRNLNAIVSGIETPDQFEILKEKDCILQGFLFDKPKDFDKYILDLLNARNTSEASLQND